MSLDADIREIDYATPIGAVTFYPTPGCIDNITTILNHYFSPEVSTDPSVGIRLGLEVAAQVFRTAEHIQRISDGAMNAVTTHGHASLPAGPQPGLDNQHLKRICE